jgi:hypothetical protein
MIITYENGNYCAVEVRPDKYAIYENGKRLETVVCPYNPGLAKNVAINIVNRHAEI